MKLAYVLPTRDRPEVLGQTLDALGSLPAHDAQVIVLDNQSATPAQCPNVLPNGLTVETIHLRHNLGAASRNIGVQVSDPGCEWCVLLDDDSAPLDLGHQRALAQADHRTAAVAAEIFLQSPQRPADWSRARRESGGLPEVFIGCGVAVRRELFLDLGGYDHRFNYYVEEYDLAARMLLTGHRIVLNRGFRVHHRKVATGRDMNTILHRLVRNNGWVAQRYAPPRRRTGELSHLIDRYRAISRVERAEAGYQRGLRELLESLHRQRRFPMTGELWDRFIGKETAATSLGEAHKRLGFRTAAVVDAGKNAAVILAVLNELGVEVVEDPARAEVLVPGTLSPGPLLDAIEKRDGDPRVVSPWASLTGMAAKAAAADRAA